jgi:hypothetical protein
MKRKRLFPIFLITILATLFSFQPYQAAAKQADLLIPLQKPAPASGDHIPASQAAESVVIDFNNITTQTPALYGSNGWWSDQDTGIWQERHHALGVRIMRIPAMQSLYEPVNDDANPEHIQQERFLFRNPVPVTGTDRTITLKNWLTKIGRASCRERV